MCFLYYYSGCSEGKEGKTELTTEAMAAKHLSVSNINSIVYIAVIIILQIILAVAATATLILGWIFHLVEFGNYHQLYLDSDRDLYVPIFFSVNVFYLLGVFPIQ